MSLARNLLVTRGSWVLVALFIFGCLSVLGYSWATRAGDATAPGGTFPDVSKRDVGARGATTDAPGHSPRAGDAAQRAEPGGAAENRSAQSDAASKLAQWIADTSSDDPQKRAEAITALAKVPKPQAMPVLRRVLNHGEPLFDRPLAVRAMRDLAIAQGDEDGSIQDALRYATYHDNDPDLIRVAEAALEAITTQLAENAALNKE
jgi:HEAT repeat protein